VAHKITITNEDEGKASHVVATQAAATLTIGAGELGIFIGTDAVAANNQQCVSALHQLKDKLREVAGGFNSIGGAVISAERAVPGGAIGLVAGAGVPVLTEDDACIAYSNTFYPAGNTQIFIGLIDRMIETFQEKVLKLT